MERVFEITLTAPGVQEHEVGGAGTGVWCRCASAEPVVLPDGTVVPRLLRSELDVAVWNGTVGERFNRWVQDVKRHVVTGSYEWEYIKVPEVGAKRLANHGQAVYHLHLLVRSGVQLPRYLEVIRRLAIKHGFGHQLTVAAVRSAGGTAKYINGYVQKAIGELDDLAIPFAHRPTGELRSKGALRAWSRSRRYGVTIKALRKAQWRWVMERRAASAAAAGGPAGVASSPVVDQLHRGSEQDVVARLCDAFPGAALV